MMQKLLRTIPGLALALLLSTLLPPSEVLARHEPIEGRHCHGSARHVHIAVGRDPSTSMTVSFASKMSTNQDKQGPFGAVLLGRSKRQLNQLYIQKEPALSYNCTHKHSNGALYFAPFQHHVSIDGLEPDTRYYYQILVRNKLSDFDALKKKLRGDPHAQEEVAEQIEEKEEEYETYGEDQGRRRMDDRTPYDPSQHGTCPNPQAIRSFRTAPRPRKNRGAKFAIIGDIGSYPHAIDTLKHLRRHHRGADAVLLAGDIAYPELDERRWDTFFDFMDDFPYVDEIPLMIATGNHDIGKPEHESTIFQAYENRFRMPRVAQPRLGTYDGPDGFLSLDSPPYPLPYEYGNSFYDFVYASAHFIVLSSYSAMEPGSQQYEWLVETLESTVNRRITPWLLVMFHVPFYNTFEKHRRDTQAIMAREHLEPLFVEHRVNMVYTGHVHAYMRTKPVVNETVTPTGPIYVTVGAGGRDAATEFFSEEPEEWLAVRDATLYGYGSLEIFNSTHARWDWIHTGQEGEHNVVLNSDVELPPGGRDHLMIYNQLYLKGLKEQTFKYKEVQLGGEHDWN